VIYSSTRAIPKVSGLDILDKIFSTVYTSVKRTSFMNSNESVPDMTSLLFMTSQSIK